MLRDGDWVVRSEQRCISVSAEEKRKKKKQQGKTWGSVFGLKYWRGLSVERSHVTFKDTLTGLSPGKDRHFYINVSTSKTHDWVCLLWFLIIFPPLLKDKGKWFLLGAVWAGGRWGDEAALRYKQQRCNKQPPKVRVTVYGRGEAKGKSEQKEYSLISVNRRWTPTCISHDGRLHFW